MSKEDDYIYQTHLAGVLLPCMVTLMSRANLQGKVLKSARVRHIPRSQLGKWPSWSEDFSDYIRSECFFNESDAEKTWREL